MRFLSGDFLRPFLIGFAAAAILVLSAMDRGPAGPAARSLLPAASAAGAPR